MTSLAGAGIVDGKSGLVTGAAGGMGRASAIRFAAEGAAVLVTDLEAQRAEGEETVRMIEADGGRAIFVAADVRSDEDQRLLVRTCVSSFGRLDFAHNNAGTSYQGSVEDTPVEEWDRVMDVNLKGVWLGMRHQLAQMREQGGGAIVNTASLGATMAIENLAAYTASKHALLGLTKAAALEAAEAGIRVNAICPSTTRTPMLEGLEPERIEEIIRPHAIRRLCEPEEVAEAVVWLASDRASLLTGVPFRIDLGASAGFSG